MKRLLLAALLSPMLATAACAQTTKAPGPAAAATPASSPARPLAPEGLEYFVGSWRAEAVDPSTGVEEVLAYRVESAVGGAWIAGAGESADLSFRSRDMWGRDAQGIVRMVFDGSGALGAFRSPGWKGDTLVFEGEVTSNGRKHPLRQTITRVGPNEFRAVWEAQRDGAWKPYSVERLTRQRT